VDSGIGGIRQGSDPVAGGELHDQPVDAGAAQDEVGDSRDDHQSEARALHVHLPP